jgi:hypothetical protein
MGYRRPRNLTSHFLALTVLIFSLFVPATVYAQVAGATLSGTVKDASGSTVPGASISIKNSATGITKEVTTDAAGFYTAPNLPPGVYEVASSASGFSTQVQTGITLTVGQQQVLDFTLAVGQVTQKVEVSSAAPQVELTSSAITHVVDPTLVQELPLNGRDWASLATLQPGVTAIKDQPSGGGLSPRGLRGWGTQLTVVGHRPTENNYRIDGISANDYSNAGPGNVFGAQLGVDAIQEFSVITTNYTAEYGRTSGGVVNAVIRPGTNTFHGNAYYYLRDEGLDARNFFDPPKIPPFHRNQFGGSAGGPIRKDKTFIFGDYEGIRQNKSFSGNSLVPSPAARGIGPNGQPTVAMLCLPNPANPIGPCVEQPLPGAGQGTPLNPAAPNPDPVTHIDQGILPYLAFYPLPNAGLIGHGDVGRFLTPIPQPLTENYVVGRVDQHFSEKDDLDGVYFYDRSHFTLPDNFLLSTTEAISARQFFSLEWTHTFSPQLVNTARIGYNRTTGEQNIPGVALQPIAADPAFSAGFIPGQPAPEISVSGLANMIGGLGSQAPQSYTQNSIQFYDDAFVTRGAHALKFGFVFEDLRNSYFNPGRKNGQFIFSGSIDSFLVNRPTSFNQTNFNISGIAAGVRDQIWGGYVQDDWRIRPNLTINLGLRYEMSTVPTEEHDRFQLVVPFLSGPITHVHNLWGDNSTLHNFEPRIGFAWDPFHDGKTSVRGGFGMYDLLPLSYLGQLFIPSTFPFTQAFSSAALPPGSFPSLSGVNLGPSSLLVYSPQRNPSRAYSMNWNLTIQRQVSKDWIGTIGYLGSHTVHSPWTANNPDEVYPPQVIPTKAGGGFLWPCGPDGKGDACAVGFLPTGTQAQPIPSAIINPNVGTIRATIFDGNSHYNGLQAALVGRIGNSLLTQESFEWGQCIDTSSNGGAVAPYNNSFDSLIIFALRGSRRGLCDFNVGKNFVTNAVWTLPSPKSNQVLKYVAGGWELNGIFIASTGAPFTMVIGGDALGQKNGTPVDFPDRIPGCNLYNSNWKASLEFVNLNCFTPATAPASMAAQCATNSFLAAPVAAPSGTVYCQNLLGNAGRNSLIGPKFVNLDFAIVKNTHVRENINVQFRTEFFNILNHANFQSPNDNNTIFDTSGALVAGAGVVDTAFDPRQIQFALRVIW